MLGIRIERLQVVKRRGGIAELAHALIVFALAAPDATEVEAKHRESKLVEGVVQAVHDPVVHRSAVQRMRMQHDRDRGVGGFLGVVAAFQAALGAGEYDFGHQFACSLSGPPSILDEFYRAT